MEHFKRYTEVGNFPIGGDAKVRVAPDLIAKIYKNNRSAVRELEEYVRSRGLEKCHAAAELPTLALILDRLVMHSGSADVVNFPAVEAICRRVYGLMRAFEDVHRESDWQKPQNHQGKWKSKVKWTLLDEYDVRALDSHDMCIPEADEEVSARLRQKALFSKHLTALEDANGAAKGE